MLCKLNALWDLHLFCLINCVLCRYYAKLTGWRKNRFTLDGKNLFLVLSDCATPYTSVYTIDASFICGLFDDAVSGQKVCR